MSDVSIARGNENRETDTKLVLKKIEAAGFEHDDLAFDAEGIFAKKTLKLRVYDKGDARNTRRVDEGYLQRIDVNAGTGEVMILTPTKVVPLGGWYLLRKDVVIEKV